MLQWGRRCSWSSYRQSSIRLRIFHLEMFRGFIRYRLFRQRILVRRFGAKLNQKMKSETLVFALRIILLLLGIRSIIDGIWG